MGHPHHSAKGFQRPIQIFTKSDLSPSQSQRSYSVTPSHTITSANAAKPVYSCLTLPDVEISPNPSQSMTPLHTVVTTSNSNSHSNSNSTSSKHTSQVYTCITSPDHPYEADLLNNITSIVNVANTIENTNNICVSTDTKANTTDIDTDENSNQNTSFKDKEERKEIQSTGGNEETSLKTMRASLLIENKNMDDSSAKCNDSEVTKNSIKRKLSTSATPDVRTNKRTCVETCDTVNSTINNLKTDQKATMHLECKDDVIECDKTVDASNEKSYVDKT